MKALDLSLFAASVVALICAPVPVQHGAGRQVQPEASNELPLTLVYCTWFGTVAVAQNYLWCAEKAWLSSVALFVGLVVNVSLDLVLLPRVGLHGAVMATTAANFTALVLIYLLNNRLGMRIARGTWMLAAVPMLLWLGPTVAVLGLVVVSGHQPVHGLAVHPRGTAPPARAGRRRLAKDPRSLAAAASRPRPAKADCWQVPARTNHL